MGIENSRVNQIISRFNVSVEQEIGRGKYGIVYMGRDLSQGKNVAIKVMSLPSKEMEEQLYDTYGDDTDQIEDIVRTMAMHFVNEIKAMQGLGKQTSHVIKMHDHILDQDGIYFDIVIIMELAEPLKVFLKQEDFTVEDVIRIGIETAEGLSVCHSNGIIHRDIKEDNLFLSKEGHIKIGDFGIANINLDENYTAKKTKGIGTPHYMAPELKDSGNGIYDSTVDIYSLGIVLYLLCNNNRPPFADTSESAHEAYDRRMNGEKIPPPQYGSTELNKVILKCCEHNPADRYGDANEVIHDLRTVKSRMTNNELKEVLPYPKRDVNFSRDWWKTNLSNETSEKSRDENIKESKSDSVLERTIDIFNNIIRRGKKNNIDGDLIKTVYGNVGTAESELNEAERRLKTMKRILILVCVAIVVMIATAIMLYPQSAKFYAATSGDRRIYVKYMLLPERRLTKESATYLSPSDGKNVFFVRVDENGKHDALCKADIWSGKTTVLDSGAFDYAVPIGNYIYYTAWDDQQKLYRIKKDGTDKKCLQVICYDLKNVNGNLSFRITSTNKEQILDVNTIN